MISSSIIATVFVILRLTSVLFRDIVRIYQKPCYWFWVGMVYWMCC